MRTNTDLKGLIPVISGTLSLQNNTSIAIVDSDFASGSFTIKDGTSNANEFTVGAAIIKGCSFVFLNDNGKFSNIDWFDSKISITFTFSNNTTLNMGEFYIVSHNETGYRISVEAYTAMKLLDEYQIYEHNFTYPITAQSAVTTIATARGLTVSGMAYPTMSLPDPGDDSITEREFVSYVAQMMGQYVVVDANNVLRFGWYSTNNAHNAGASFSSDVRTSDITITGVKVTSADGQLGVTTGSSGYMLNITDNPLINQSNLATIAAQIYGAVNGITFRPGVVTITSDANIEAGDFISVNVGDGYNSKYVNMLATTIVYKPSTRMKITADAEPYDGDLRISRTQRMQIMMQNESSKAINKQLANSNSPLSQAIAQGGSGGGTKKIGGANNQYGTIEQYNASDELMSVRNNYSDTGYDKYKRNLMTQNTNSERTQSILWLQELSSADNGSTGQHNVKYGDTYKTNGVSGTKVAYNNGSAASPNLGYNPVLMGGAKLNIRVFPEVSDYTVANSAALDTGDTQILRYGYGDNADGQTVIRAQARAYRNASGNDTVGKGRSVVDTYLGGDDTYPVGGQKGDRNIIHIHSEKGYDASDNPVNKQSIDIGNDGCKSRVHGVFYARDSLYLRDASDDGIYLISIVNGQLTATLVDYEGGSGDPTQ